MTQNDKCIPAEGFKCSTFNGQCLKKFCQDVTGLMSLSFDGIPLWDGRCCWPKGLIMPIAKGIKKIDRDKKEEK
jgi:hypothetical protein